LLYIAYWAFLATAFFLTVFGSRLAISNGFMQWIKKESPVLIWTPEGLSFEDNRTSARLDHPLYGPLAVIDTTRKPLSPNELGRLYLFVTSERIYFKHPMGRAEERVITKAGVAPQKKIPSRVRVTGALIERFYKNAIITFILIAPLVLIPIFSFMFLAIAFTYSLAGLLLNLMRKNKLSYGNIFTVTCFATGISLALTGLQTLEPLQSCPWPTPVNFLLPLIYMSATITLTDKTTP
jgi:hypothetical protein